MRCGAGSLVLKQGWVLLAGFVGCSWGIAFYWKYVGSSVGCWLFMYDSFLVRVLAPDRGYQVCLFSMGSAPFGLVVVIVPVSYTHLTLPTKRIV